MPQYVLLEEKQLNHTTMQETNGKCDFIVMAPSVARYPY
jgi:hypothetical protein